MNSQALLNKKIERRVKKLTLKRERGQTTWDTLTKEYIFRLAEFLNMAEISTLLQVNSWFYTQLRQNKVWISRVQRVEAGSKLPKMIFKRAQPVGFWFNWYRANVPHSVRIRDARRVMFREPEEAVPTPHYVPVVGSLLVRATTFVVCTDIHVPLKGKFSDLPERFTVAEVTPDSDLNWDTLDNTTHVQYLDDTKLEIKLNDWCNPTNNYSLLLPIVR
jgi:hypothetical protein